MTAGADISWAIDAVRTEGHGVVEFDMVALETGIDLVEFPLIENDWDGADGGER